MNRRDSNRDISQRKNLRLEGSVKPMLRRDESLRNSSFRNLFYQPSDSIIKPIVSQLLISSPSSQSSSSSPQELSPHGSSSSPQGSSSSPQGLSPIVRKTVLPQIQERPIMPYTAADIQQQLQIHLATTNIGEHARNLSQQLRKSSISAPVLTSSSIGITKTPYELSLHECYKEFLSVHHPELVSISSTKIDIDKYNKIFVEFVLYTLYNVYNTQGGGQNISEFYNIISSINTYIDEVNTIFSNIIRDLDSSDNFKIGNLTLSHEQVKSIKSSALSTDDINELDILSYLLNKNKDFFVNIIKQGYSLRTFDDNYANIENILSDINKLEIYHQFGDELIINIFENINFRVIFKKISGIIMRNKIKDYYTSIKPMDDNDYIYNILQNYSQYIHIIQKVYYFFETLYFFYNITIHNLNTDDSNINQHKAELDLHISQIQARLLSSQSIYSRELTKETTLNAVSSGRFVLERLTKFGVNREDVAKSFKDLKTTMNDIDKNSPMRNPLIKLSEDLNKLKNS